MARIAGVLLPNNKRIEAALTYIFGIGFSSSKKILKDTGIDPNTLAKDLKEEDVAKIMEYITKNYQIEGDLRRKVSGDIKRLKDISSYRGARHRKHLPVRGQRTKTNSRTVRGNVRKTAGSGRKPPAQKT